MHDVAGELMCSKSTLYRELSRAGTTFTEQREIVRLELALSWLRQGQSVVSIARRLEISPDHLRVRIKANTGLTPQKIQRAVKLDATIRRWRAQVPPASGTPWYWKQRRQWLNAHDELRALLGELPPDHSLAKWAKSVIEGASRPDYRSAAGKDELQERRQAYQQALEDFLATYVRKAG